MKRYRLPSVLLVMLVLLGSCSFPEQPYWLAQPWLCSINAEGTGFRKIKKVDLNFGTTGFWDIYMTKDDRIIFYGQKLWISDPDTIRVEQITPDNLTLWHLPSRLSQSPDGSKLYFAAEKNIHELDLNTKVSRQLTSESVRTLRNPIISDLGNYLTYSSKRFGGIPLELTEYIHWVDLRDLQTGTIPSIDSMCVNVYFSETEKYAYYQSVNLKRSRLDGGELSVVTGGGSINPNSTYGVTANQRYIITALAYYPTEYIKCYDKQQNVEVQLPVLRNSNADFLARISKNANRIFYVPLGAVGTSLRVYDIDTAEDRVLLQDTDKIIYSFINIAPTWDGSKVFFYADIAENIGG